MTNSVCEVNFRNDHSHFTQGRWNSSSST